MRALILVLLLVADVPSAQASGLNLAWDLCRGDGGTPNRTFACNTQFGTDSAVLSFAVSSDSVPARIVEAVVDIQTRSGSALPAWWQLRGVGACRLGQLSVDGVLPAGSTGCRTLTGLATQVTVLNRFDFQTESVDRAMIVVSSAVSNGVPVLSAELEYFVGRIVLTRANAVGPTPCAGCSEPILLTLSQVRVASSTAGTAVVITAPAAGNTASWQTAGVTASRRTTWGAVKSLYH